jgi:hypothetical protein
MIGSSPMVHYLESGYAANAVSAKRLSMVIHDVLILQIVRIAAAPQIVVFGLPPL